MIINLSAGKVKMVPAEGNIKFHQNTGEAFYHPVTHQLIPTGGFYQGAAHLDHENEPELESQGDDDAQGGLSLVGQEDPELIVLPTDSQVTLMDAATEVNNLEIPEEKTPTDQPADKKKGK
jgi:hypothetical protein